jgi:hypothetical protein
MDAFRPKPRRERAEAIVRESERRRRESALTILFSATMLLNSRLRLARTRRLGPARG